MLSVCTGRPTHYFLSPLFLALANHNAHRPERPIFDSIVLGQSSTDGLGGMAKNAPFGEAKGKRGHDDTAYPIILRWTKHYDAALGTVPPPPRFSSFLFPLESIRAPANRNSFCPTRPNCPTCPTGQTFSLFLLFKPSFQFWIFDCVKSSKIRADK
jgi:hypothetical protein